MKANNNFNKKIYEAVLENQKEDKVPDETEQEPSKDKTPTEDQSGEKTPDDEPKTPQEDSPLKEE